MYYSAGTYESFAHPEKPKDVDKKSAYIIGTGLAGLTAAFYLVRDGQMKGEHIHLLEKLELAGGSCDGRKDVTKASLCVAAERWTTTLKSCGIRSGMSHPLKRPMCPFLTNTTGSTSTTPTIPSAVLHRSGQGRTHR